MNPGLVGPRACLEPNSYPKKAKIYQKRPNSNFFKVAKKMLKRPNLLQFSDLSCKKNPLLASNCLFRFFLLAGIPALQLVKSTTNLCHEY